MKKVKRGDVVRLFGKVGIVADVRDGRDRRQAGIEVHSGDGVSDVSSDEVEVLMSGKEMKDLFFFLTRVPQPLSR